MFKKMMVVPLILLSLLLPLTGSATAESVNLVSGMAYTVENGVPTQHSYSNFSENGATYDSEDGLGIAGKLTDGVRAKSGVKDPAWYTTFRSRSRYVTFAFDAPVAVDGFSAGFYHDSGSAFYAPRYVNLYLSDNGEDWFLAGTCNPSFPLNASSRRFDAKLSIEPTAAKYVRVEYCCDIFGVCDEIEIYGSKTLTGQELTIKPDSPEEPYYCTSLEGITDVIKMYNGYFPSAQDRAQNTVEELLPYVAYLSAEGEIRDTMFDAVAFVPCVSTNFAYPSGGTLVKTSKYPAAVMSDWIYYTDFLFEEGYDLDALNTAVEQVYSKLGIEGKFPVLLTMPYAGIPTKPFGDLDGDGKADYTRTPEERAAAVKWYDEYVTQRFEQANFSHLELVGYYWYGEEVNYSWSEDEARFTKLATKAIEDGGKSVLFDPFYLSTGFDHWQELGFDAAVMQPNVAFTDSRPYFDTEMLWEFADTIGKYHLGVEVETNEPSFFTNTETMTEAVHNYERYLFAGYKTGYMSALHTFYQGAGPGTLYNFCHSTGGGGNDRKLRRLYDITYQFIKETYENLPPSCEIPKEAYVPAGERSEIGISVSDADSFPGDLKAVVESCANGRAQISATKKSLIFIPDEGFTGDAEVVITVTDGQNETMEYTLVLHVGEEPPAVSEEPSNAPSVPEEPSRGGNYLWILIAVWAAAAFLAVVALLTKKRK